MNNYYIENCVIFENKVRGKLVSIRVVPYDGYTLRETIKAEDGTISYIYIDGVVVVSIKNIEDRLKVLEAVEIEREV